MVSLDHILLLLLHSHFKTFFLLSFSLSLFPLSLSRLLILQVPRLSVKTIWPTDICSTKWPVDTIMTTSLGRQASFHSVRVGQMPVGQMFFYQKTWNPFKVTEVREEEIGFLFHDVSPQSFFLPFSSLPLSLSLTHTHSLSLSLTHTQHSLSLTHTHTHSHTRTLSLSHTHSLSVTHTHTLSLSFILN